MAEAEHHGHQEGEVAVAGDCRLEPSLDTDGDQEIDRKRKGDVVGEEATAEKEGRAEEDERNRVAPFAAVQTGSDEAPDLEKEVGRGQEDRCQSRDLDVEEEGLGDRQEDELLALRCSGR